MHNDVIQPIVNEIEAGIALPKCQKCGCMREALEHFAAQLPNINTPEATALAAREPAWSQQLRPVQYSCLGCEYCYGAVAQNAFAAAFPGVEPPPLACDFQARDAVWPTVVGEYSVLDSTAHVAVSTLGSIALADELAQRKPKGLAVVGKTETENIGIDKVVRNIVTNHAIQYLVLAGSDPAGHQSGKTFVALSQNGVDEKGRVIGSPGKRPVLRNVTAEEIAEFRKQVQVVDLIGCEDPAEIIAEIEKLSPTAAVPCG